MFQTNQIIGSYTLISRIGRGGFGEVWLAERRTTLLTTEIAIKLPLDEQVDLETIKQEASLWKQASGHPNILSIIEANIYDGQVVIVSEYAPDGSLADMLKKSGKLSVEKAVEMTLGILAGLEYLHTRQIIHRDLKPANILLQGEMPRLADFGISRALKTTQTSQSVNITGTPPYMAPEAFDGKRSMQTDIWSVGVILYYLLAGRLPFPQQDITSLIGAIAARNPEPLPETVPQAIKAIVSGALAKNPELRFKSAADMQLALRKARNVKEQPVIVPSKYEDSEIPTIVAKPKSKTIEKTNMSALVKKTNKAFANTKPRKSAIARLAIGIFRFYVALIIFLLVGGIVAGIAYVILKKLNYEGNIAQQSSTESIPSNSIRPNTKSSQKPTSKTPKTPPPTEPPPTVMPQTEIPQDDINKQNEEVLKTAQNNLEKEMLQTAQRKAIELHTGSDFDGRPSISNHGQYDRVYTFLMKGKYFGINKFRVVIMVNGEIVRQGNTIFPKIVRLQIIENSKITN